MEEIKKVCQELRYENIDFALLTSVENVIYASGFEVPVAFGAIDSLAEGFPHAMVLIDARNDHASLITLNFYAGLVKEKCRLHNPLLFPVFNHFEYVNPAMSYISALKAALKDAGLLGAKARIGIEHKTLPSVLFQLLVHEFPGLEIENAETSLLRARKIKTGREIELLRNAAYVADSGQKALIDATASNKNLTEFDVWAEVQKNMNNKAGLPVPLSGELVTGPRTSVVNYPCGPIPRSIQKGDLGLMDISPRVNGYWADCTNVVVFGDTPNKEQIHYFKIVKDAFEAALEALRPGARCCDVEAAARRSFEKNGYKAVSYIGHQIGTSVNEYPRITCYDQTVIEPNMVFCLEPQQYSGNQGSTGVRLERMVWVKESGVEVLNKFPWGITSF